MKVLVPGHRYELELFEPDSHLSRMHGQPQVVQFIHKEPVDVGRKDMRTVSPGTTNEEVLDMMHDRLEFLQGRMPCPENAEAIACIKTARRVLAERTARRQAIGIEGHHCETAATDKPASAMVAKFRVTRVESFGGSDTTPPTSETISMMAVSEKPFDAEGASEDNSFARWTPFGELKMTVTNPALIGTITEGRQFYLNFTPAP